MNNMPQPAATKASWFSAMCLAIACAAALMLHSTARAADISAVKFNNDLEMIIIKGEIKKGDLVAFQRMADKKQKVLVPLSSPGGDVGDALAIGAEIQALKFATGVADDCASACGLIWLSGVRRYLSEYSRVGFHAAYTVRNGIPTETGMGNADIGSYLTHLGLSRAAIQFITAAAPGEIRWLSRADATRLGIRLMPDTGPKVPPGTIRDKPMYESAPPEAGDKRTKAASLAFVASQLVTALSCKSYYRVDEKRIRQMHAKAMKDGELIDSEFGDFIFYELQARKREAKRDGLERFCLDQRASFAKAGITDIYLE